ncbi:guanine-N(7)--methyltransferase non-catalytic subunit TRM82 [Favolaschia claudopus]|uniref:Guanine-N(7)--methyltransferase non-catalytic subunit TRM82 n=1 Tax=Favolaschia claudopus TaxID=2862362 RepID=A0AAW0BGU3_9AGAR
MSLFPHTRLFVEPSLAIVISGPHIQILDAGTGDLTATTANFPDAEKESVLKSGPIRVAAVDALGTHLVTCGDDKILKLWQIDGLKLLNERELPKRPTGLAFTRDGQTILTSDKFGDIFSYELNPAPQTAEQKKTALASHENPSGGKLILGHTSFLTAFLLTPDEKFIVTADRDEHIRVSWYPQGYTIEMYCLGHKKFVSALHIPESSPTELISGGGDPMLKIWDWMTGKLKREIPILEAVEPFIKVKPSRRTPRRFEEGGDENEEGTTKKKSRKAKARAKQQAKKEEMEDSAAADPSPPELPDADPPPETVLAIHRIHCLDRHIIFSVVGATALFSCACSEDVTPEIHAFEFSKPVVDFTVAHDGRIWVSLDGQWSETGADSADSTPTMVRVVQLSGNKLVDIPGVSLLSSLNSSCLLLATIAQLKTLDIYQALSALPKNNEVEYDPMDRDAMEIGADNLSKKELGRLKSKQAVAKAHSTLPASEEGPGELDEPCSKRAKSQPSEQDPGDVAMDGS